MKSAPNLLKFALETIYVKNQKAQNGHRDPSIFTIFDAS